MQVEFFKNNAQQFDISYQKQKAMVELFPFIFIVYTLVQDLDVSLRLQMSIPTTPFTLQHHYCLRAQLIPNPNYLQTGQSMLQF